MRVIEMRAGPHIHIAWQYGVVARKAPPFLPGGPDIVVVKKRMIADPLNPGPRQCR